jgi:hypothetical protein
LYCDLRGADLIDGARRPIVGSRYHAARDRQEVAVDKWMRARKIDCDRCAVAADVEDLSGCGGAGEGGHAGAARCAGGDFERIDAQAKRHIGGGPHCNLSGICCLKCRCERVVASGPCRGLSCVSRLKRGGHCRVASDPRGHLRRISRSSCGGFGSVRSLEGRGDRCVAGDPSRCLGAHRRSSCGGFGRIRRSPRRRLGRVGCGTCCRLRSQVGGEEANTGVCRGDRTANARCQDPLSARCAGYLGIKVGLTVQDSKVKVGEAILQRLTRGGPDVQRRVIGMMCT